MPSKHALIQDCLNNTFSSEQKLGSLKLLGQKMHRNQLKAPFLFHWLLVISASNKNDTQLLVELVAFYVTSREREKTVYFDKMLARRLVLYSAAQSSPQLLSLFLHAFNTQESMSLLRQKTRDGTIIFRYIYQKYPKAVEEQLIPWLHDQINLQHIKTNDVVDLINHLLPEENLLSVAIKFKNLITPDLLAMMQRYSSVQNQTAIQGYLKQLQESLIMEKRIMKLKCIMLILAVIMPLSSVHAEWKTIKNYSVDATDPDSVGWSFDHFPSLSNLLLGFELSHSSKLVVTHLTGQVSTMRWVNDDNCTISSRVKIKQRTVTVVDFDSYWTDNPNEIHHGFLHEFISPPCHISANDIVKRTVQIQ